ncbi:unnamed protein product [Adineta ricciae]|uniref:Uncharacterized protein n=1 Tax=Adineta ricciae TaxID=249248 RepID=A0A815Z883_ADIRI|nr:unnamed protein product [Adineta ricciae]CAF1581448.1 unnamed protein product [Adineta ricciae]
MFYYKLFVALLVIANGSTKPTANQPDRCCFPKRFSSKIFVTSQTRLPDGAISTSFFEYEQARDVENGLFATRGPTVSDPNHGYSPFWYLSDYKNNVRYTIFPGTNACVKEIITYQHEDCILESVSYANSSMYNDNGKEVLADTWISDKFGIISYQKISRDSCITLESGINFETIGQTSTSVTKDFLEDIVDPKIFTVPPECQ